MGEFDDLIPKSEFEDLVPKGAFDDLIPEKKLPPPRVPITAPAISTITGKPTTGIEQIPPVNLEPLSGLRPLEFALAPLTAFRASIIAGLKKKVEGATMAEQAQEMLDWFNAGLGEWARPIGEAPETPMPTDITGHKGVGGFIENLILDPSNLLLFGGIKNLAPKIAGTLELQKMEKATAATKMADLFATGEPAIAGVGSLKNVPAVIPKRPSVIQSPMDELARILTTEVGKKKQLRVPQESLMGQKHAEWKLGTKLKVTQSIEQKGEETVFRLTNPDDKKIFAELSLKEHPTQNALEVSWLNIDKNGIDVTKRKGTRIGKSESIPGLYKEIHRKLEMYADEKGFGLIGTNPTSVGKQRLNMVGFRDVADDLMGEVPYSMYKRVGQNINFEHPDFWNKYNKHEIFQRKGAFAQEKAKEIYNKAFARNLHFDLTSDNKFTFFDEYLQPIQKFDKIEDAEKFVNSIQLSSKHILENLVKYQSAESMYNLARDGTLEQYIQQATKEVGNIYRTGVGRKEFVGVETYRKFISPETQQKIAKGGETIKKKIVQNAANDVNDVFDLGKGEIVAVSKNVPIKESYLTTLSKVKDTPQDFYQRVLTGRGWLTTPLQFFERQGNDIKEMFYRRIKVAEKRAAQEAKNLDNEVDILAKQLNLGKKEFVRVGDYALAQDPIGRATLEKAMKKVVPELTDNEMKFYQYMRGKYEEFFNRVNEARGFAGLDPIQYRGDYFTFFRQYDELEKMGYFLNTPEFSQPWEKFVHRISTPFVHEKLRKGGFIPLEENAKDVFLRYSRSALSHIHMTPPIAIDRALLKKFSVGKEKIIDLSESAPHFNAWVQRWLDDIAGQRAVNELPRWVEGGVNTLNRNITYAFLSGAIRSALIQTTAIVNSFVELGPKYLFEGIRDWMSGVNQAIKKSNVLLTREYEQSVVEAFKMVREPGFFTRNIENITGYTHPTMRAASRGYVGTKQAVARTGMKPLQFLDMQTAQITWNGAYKKAKNYLKMAEQEAINYADDTVTRTQGSGKISDLSGAQRTVVGKTVLTLQTFVVNNWNFLMKDVLGISNPAMKNKERFEKVIKLLIGVGITNFVFEDLLGTYSPFPSPVKAYIEGREKGSSVPGALVKSVKELSEVIPGIGGAIRYGSHPFGPLAEVAGQIPQVLAGRPTSKPPAQIIGNLLGIPGTSQMFKIGKGMKKEAGVIETILGIRETPEKPKKQKLGVQKFEKLGPLTLED